MRFKRNFSGFAYDEFEDKYGERCIIKKSSIVSTCPNDECIWLGVLNREGMIRIFPREPVNPNEGQAKFGFGPQEKCLYDLLPGCDIEIPSRMHLSQEMVKMLLPALIHFAETGELPEPKKDTLESYSHVEIRDGKWVSRGGPVS